MKQPPEGSVEASSGIYSNIDHVFDEAVEKEVAKGKILGHHAAWNFSGWVWFEGGKWYEKVMQHHVHVETLEGDCATDVIHQANQEYGSE